ncbi:MAG: acyltransferase [Anaerolineales bacterium]|nr:acyltransferase [Anaerolineales bacterium]
MFSQVLDVLKRDFRFQVFREAIFLWIANHLPRLHTSDALRALVLKLAGMRIQYPVQIWAPVEVRPIGAAGNITIGRDTFINSRVRFAARPPAAITIGAGVLVGPRCSFETIHHALVADAQGHRVAEPRSVVVEDQVWLGAGVTILPGVTIGRGSVIAAGAVVAADVPPHCLYGGVPARLIRSLAESNI